MMEIAELRRYLDICRSEALSELEIDSPRFRLRVRSDPGAPQAGPLPAIVAAEREGTFLTRHPLQPEPFAPVGAKVRRGDIVALLGVGVLYHPVTAPRAGRIAELLAVPGEIVPGGAPLFRIVPA